ncbi:MAG: hypothetical protein PUP92_15620 [Rhizonema sp. PD38]|nr:hypothetical protein [Rhizonema sp. PD38]
MKPTFLITVLEKLKSLLNYLRSQMIIGKGRGQEAAMLKEILIPVLCP